MIDTTDTLQIMITKAREELSPKSRGAIDAVSWKLIIAGMNKKFNPEQLENLETETELLLCGLVSTIDYPKELEARMKIPKAEVASLLEEMDKLVFKKIQEELEKRIDGKEGGNNMLSRSKPLILDPRFVGLPKDTQEAIALSGWKEILYGIVKEYKVTVDKMGLLEEITTKRLLGIIPVDQYDNEISSKVGLPEDKTKELVIEINEKIFKNIKELLKSNWGKRENIKLPLPPYAIKKEVPTLMAQVEMPPKQKEPNLNNSDIYREHGIEILSDNSNEIIPEIKKEEKIVESVVENKPEEKVVSYREELPEKNKESNIMTDKLFGNTTSKSTVSDYSLPKMNNQSPDFNKIEGEVPEKPHDPYHEAI